MNQKFYLCVLAISFSVLFGCQPNPETNALIGKRNTEMLDAALKGADPTISLQEKYQIPSEYTGQIKSKNQRIIVEFKAKLTVPKTNSIPLLRVVSADFTQETVYTLFNNLCKNTIMTQYTEVRTKNEIAQTILDLQSRLELEEDWEQRQEIERALIKWKEDYLKAPEAIQQIISDGTLSNNEILDPKSEKVIATYTGLVAEERRATSIGKLFQVVNNTDLKQSFLSSAENQVIGLRLKRDAVVLYTNYGIPLASSNHSICEVEEIDGKHKNEILSMAISAATQLMEDCNLNDFEMNRIYQVVSEKDRSIIAYQITYTRAVNGTPFVFISGASGGKNDSAAPSWTYETLCVSANEDGVFQFIWQAPIEITEIVTENASLLTFSEMFERATRGLISKYSYESSANLDHIRISINEITLSLQRIIEQNSYDSGLAVPAWNMYGDVSYYYSDGSCYSHTNTDDYRKSLISINAVDGSIIDSDLGY